MANLQESFMSRPISGALWQDYRASNVGMVIFYGGDPISELPIREVPVSYPSDIAPEPNYETGTFGFYSCSQTKIRSTFVKSRIRYLIFITKYIGTNEDFKGRYYVTGYYRVTKIADVKRQHIRFCEDFSCLDENVCMALRSDESRFVAIEDAFPVNDEILKKQWGFGGRITRQSRIILTEQQTAAVVDYLNSKPDIQDKYIEETTRLQPRISETGGDDDE
jgi:hypothetical protein